MVLRLGFLLAGPVGLPRSSGVCWKTWHSPRRYHLVLSWMSDLKLPLIWFEWCCGWASYWLGQWAFLEVLEYVGKLGILLAVITWFYPGCQERKSAVDDSTKSRHYIAWQTLNSAVGKPGN